MDQAVTIGLDIAKSVFQVHGVDGAGAVVLRQRLTRSRLLAFFAKRAPCANAGVVPSERLRRGERILRSGLEPLMAPGVV